MLIVALCLASCRTPQQIALQEQQHLQENERVQEQQIHRLQEQVSLLQSQMIHQQQEMSRRMAIDAREVAQVITEEFDTTQPVDSNTGTPPLRIRRTEKRNRQAQAVSTETEAIHTAQQTDRQWERHLAEQDSLTAQSNINRETETETDTQQKTGLNWWQTTLCTIGGTCLLALILWLAIKILKRYLKPF